MSSRTLVRGLMPIALRMTTISLALLLSASAVARAELILTYTTPGTSSVTLPACTVTIQCWGAGGNGSNENDSYYTGYGEYYSLGGNGGGGGGYSASTFTLPAGTYYFQVGQGGGGQGTSTSIGGADTVWDTATNMSPHATGGRNASTSNERATGSPGIGGTGYGGDISNEQGGSGGYGSAIGSGNGYVGGGGGGGSAGPDTVGSDGGAGGEWNPGSGGDGYAKGGIGAYLWGKASMGSSPARIRASFSIRSLSCTIPSTRWIAWLTPTR